MRISGTSTRWLTVFILASMLAGCSDDAGKQSSAGYVEGSPGEIALEIMLS